MKNMINIAELLKDCPKGMELYSPIYGLGNLTKVTDRIHVKFPKEHNVKCFRFDGKVSENGEVMIFPKGKTTWEGFVPPCEFKDGDVLAESSCIFIIQKLGDNNTAAKTYCTLYGDGIFDDGTILYFNIDSTKPATEEEKQKLFDAIKENGYQWNSEINTLEKLIEPRFDITTLVPFKSEVLVRNDEHQYWIPAFWGCKHADGYITTFGRCKYCIPFEENKHLLETNNDCDEYFKIWE